jgi:hypothetical protein
MTITALSIFLALSIARSMDPYCRPSACYHFFHHQVRSSDHDLDAAFPWRWMSTKGYSLDFGLQSARYSNAVFWIGFVEAYEFGPASREVDPHRQCIICYIYYVFWLFFKLFPDCNYSYYCRPSQWFLSHFHWDKRQKYYKSIFLHSPTCFKYINL